jgi:tRNA modification GTPase
MRQKNATYVSLLTPVGQGGISIITLYGPDAKDTLGRAFHAKNQRLFNEHPAGRLFYGLLKDGEELIDEVIVECADEKGCEYAVNCHGGVVAAEAILRLFAKLGAERISSLDLAAIKVGRLHAEILEALTGASTERNALLFAGLLQGALEEEIRAIDDMAHGAVRSRKKRDECLAHIGKLLATYGAGRSLLVKKRIVIAGRPNVGKSSLANALAGIERSIVDETPGTTRDLVRSRLAIGGTPFEIVDTAGLSAIADGVEAEGVKRAAGEIEKADGLLFVLDGSSSLSAAERDLLGRIDAARTICVINKVDLPRKVERAEVEHLFPGEIMETSAKERRNVKALAQAVYEKVSGRSQLLPGAVFIFTERQKRLLEELASCLEGEDGRIDADCIDRKCDEFILGA